MEAEDYRRNGLFEDGIPKGMALSVLVHVVVLMLALGVSWLMPSRKIDPMPCTVILLNRQDLGGGGGQGEEGTMSPGPGETKGVGGSPAIPPPPEPEAATEPELETTSAMQSTEVVKETVSPVSLPKKVEKPVERPKPKPRPVAGPQQKQQTIATAAHPPPVAPRTTSEGPGTPDGASSTHGGGHGMGDAAGTGLGHSGEGPGAGPGVGGGGNQGPYTASFGSGDGPRFVTKVLPKYPRLARELGKEGVVLLLLTIDEHGRLIDVQVSKRAGSGFDEEALRAVKDSTFTPAKRNGRPVLCKASLPVHFVLKGADEN